MKKQEAAEIIGHISEYNKKNGTADSWPPMLQEVIDLAIAALREQPAPQAIEWKPGPPDKKGTYHIITRIGRIFDIYDQYDPADEYWNIDEVLFHIGPIPKPPDLNK